MDRPKITRFIKEQSEYKDYILTISEIKKIVDWYYLNIIWHKIDSNDKESYPTPFESVQLYVPDKAPLPCVIEGYIDNNKVFHSIRIGEGIVQPTHWCFMTTPPDEVGMR